MSAAHIDPGVLQQRVAALPALPKAALDALAALRDDDTSAEHCAAQIARDPALAARTLRLANSAFYGLAGRVGSVRDAVNMLGRRTLCSAITAAVVSDQIREVRCEGFDFAGFWRHAAGVAIAARAVARELQLDEEAAFTVGLLHDIGRLALAAYFPQQLAAVLRRARAEDLPPCELEEPLMHVDHAELGAAIIAQWRLPAAVVDAVRHHHRPPLPASAKGASPPRADLADVAHLADAVAHALDLSEAEDEAVPQVDLAAWGRLGLKPAQFHKIFQQTEQGVAALGQALGL
ncbi:HDOD domain-containing protein [Aquincola sp. S2]|uniref:HDOD domain-containing protein n=1 Tax=Pseudaquabacterium terrae TaxID=2732868 RepID=A0ABX2ESU7_9BURK|nr:HDOD domain-containing protein [Aquabacterium terrae]NRF71820.1 HDOD domain-containing protein [Aquabacterium terrae]